MKNRPFTVALTGGIGAGKSTVANLFKTLGVPIIDTDLISRELVMPGTDCLNQIVNHFGKSVVDEKGVLKRAVLREKIFTSPKDKIWLEKCLHPRIYEVTQQQIASQIAPYVIIVIPLLVESGRMNEYDSVLVVDAPEAVQIARAAKRDELSPAQIKAMIATQCPPEERMAVADAIISNEGDLKSLEEQVAQLHENYLALAKQN